MTAASSNTSPDSAPVLCAVLTVSDEHTPETDESGRLIRELLTQAGHIVRHYALVRDEPNEIEVQLRSWLTDPTLQVICTTGGTGVARRDTTIEVVNWLIDKPIHGFGELFRMLFWQEIGPASMLTRATAGLAGDTFIFALPGSVHAVRLAMEKLILPELRQLISERRR